MPVAPFPFVDELTIARLVGPLSYSRGRTYAADGRVTRLEWQSAQQRLSGEVQGTDPRPYRVTALLAGSTTARVLVRSATCTCPLALNCKHVVALLLESNSRHRAQEVPAPPAAATGWRGLVSTFEPVILDAATPRRPLALQFALRAGGRTGRPAPARTGRARRDELAMDAASVTGLVVRPVTRGARGGWIRGDLTWQNVGYQGAGGGFDSTHARWFGQLATLRSTSLGGFADYGSEWITLDAFESTLLWALLDEGRALGIPLVAAGSASTSSVEVGASATIGFDAQLAGDSLVLSPRVVIDAVSYDAAHAGLIGAHGAYAYSFAGVDGGPAISLARLANPATRAQRGIIARPQRVTVDAADLAEFLDEHFVTLARSVHVTSSDASFAAPPVPPASLVLTARYESGNVLRLGWEWELAGRRRVPLTAPDAVFLEPRAERAPATAVAALLQGDLAGGLALNGGELRAATVLRGIDAAEFTARLLPAIAATDRVRVDVIGEQPAYREIVETPELTVSAVETESNDWFDLGVIVRVEGKPVPFGPLFRALSRGARKLLLVDQSYLSLDQPVFAPLRELIDEAGSLEEWETGLRISRYQTALYAEFEDLADQSEAATAWRATVDGLRDLSAIEQVAVPTAFTGELRPYQREGLNWLAFLHTHGLGGILADDMGLGKTAQTLALIAHAAELSRTAPFLVVAPTSVVSNWAREVARFTPALRVAEISETRGKSGTALRDAADGADIVLTTYAILRLDAEEFAAHDWAGLVLDEAQFAKNPASRVHAAARGIRARFRLAVTGTPIENNLSELWALFQIVAPGLFPSAREFAEKYRRPIETNHDAERLARLRRRVRPFLLRRTKESVAPELPAKQEQVLEIPLDARHRRIYDTHLQRERQRILGLVDDLDRNRFIVFRSLTLLRMLSLDASLIDPVGYAHVPSTKLDALLEQLDDVVGEGHRALVFSQFTSFLQRAAARLESAGISYVYLDGTTRRRGEVIDAFRRGEAPVFLISLKAGGFGLNLTEADYVFLLDPWWNPASEAQAVDRTHRIGQDKQVMVYRLVAEGTIEQKVMALKEKKAALVSAVLDDDAFFSEALSADDIRGLLEG